MGLKFWNKPCYTCDVKKSIELGFLVDYDCYGTNNGLVLPQISSNRDFTEKEIKESLKNSKVPIQVDEFIKLCNHFKLKKVCVLASNIEHAEEIYNEITKYEDCILIHSKIKNANDLIERYKKGKTRMSVSIGMIAEGFDAPIVDGIVLLRATNSSRLLTQIIGRGLRLYTRKEKCIVLDYSGSVLRCGDPKNPIIPSPQKKSKSEPSPIRQCEECFYIFEREGNGNTCPNCGHKHVQVRDVEKNLKKSLMENNVEEIVITRDNFYRFGKSKNGNLYLTIFVNDKYHTLFGFQRKVVLAKIKTTGKVKIFFTKEGKSKFKFIKAESC